MDHLLLKADARRIPLADDSVHCVVTSPPYYGLRDYGTGRWVGGDPSCNHRRSNARPDQSNGVMLGTRGERDRSSSVATPFGHTCGKCGATREDLQIGLERTPEAFVAELVEVFREVRRVLRDDGTCWINIGDSYNAKPPGNKNPMSKSGLNGSQTSATYRARLEQTQQHQQSSRRLIEGLKPKDLIGIPWMLAFALRADGWYLRSECIWSKRSGMPESVTDRPSKAHETVFLLSKGPRYFYDHVATRRPQKTLGRRHEGKSGYRDGHPSKGGISHRTLNPLGAADRTVWHLSAGGGYKGAHYATMPVLLAEKCIKLGSSEKGCCPRCGAPWRRVLEKERVPTRPGTDTKVQKADVGYANRCNVVGNRDPERHTTIVRMVGWESSCTCLEPEPVPCTIFDPFAGAATTLLVAGSLGRRSIGTDLSEEYLVAGNVRLSRPHSPARKPKPVDGTPMPLFSRRA